MNVVTVLEGEGAGQKLLVFADGTVEGDLYSGDTADQVVADARAALQAARSETRSYGSQEAGQANRLIYLESIVPPPWLIIVGAGHTSIRFSALAKVCGFKVTLVDPRSAFAESNSLQGS